MNTAIIDGHKLHHGMSIECKIDGRYIKDAKVSISDNGSVFICQNYRDGAKAHDRLGYKYSWFIGSGLKCNDVSELSLTRDNYEIF